MGEPLVNVGHLSLEQVLADPFLAESIRKIIAEVKEQRNGADLYSGDDPVAAFNNRI